VATDIRSGLGIAWTTLVVLTCVLFVTTLMLIFVQAPVEMQMGIVQKIFYFHVPSAYAMYLSFAICGVGSLVYLIRQSERWDAWALAGGEVGLLFCAIVLLTGPLWARKAWGVFWTWDPRLTTTLLAGLIFLAYVVLRSFGGREPEKKFAAALALLGLVDLPIVHYSVQRWRGQHPTVITKSGGGLSADMVPALLVSFLVFTLLTVLLIWIRARLELLRNHVETLQWEHIDSTETG